jgi:hypothetical protein
LGFVADMCLVWGIKPVSVAIEFFKIDRDKKPSKLTTVRFTQTGGAATSLRALIDELFDIFYMTGAVLEHVEEANKIIAMIQTGKTTTT